VNEPRTAGSIDATEALALDYRSQRIGDSRIVLADCFDWLRRIPADSLHAIVTDPPYGVKEYDFDQLTKRADGNGGVWRIPPSFDGHRRAPLPRFTALDARQRERMRSFFAEWSRLVLRVLRPGGHVFMATSSVLAQLLYGALAEGGLEFRGQVIRLVKTLRGGDRPKNAEADHPDVASMARGGYEPWGIFRRPLPAGMRVSDCLGAFQTGALRRRPDGKPFCDVIAGGRTPKRERALADHPSLKPQAFLRQLVRAALPLEVGVVADPFMGAGSTIAAAEALGLTAVGVERHPDYYALAAEAIPKLRDLDVPADAPVPAG
jgi:site-specific DNA-methyltransferase (adenine-specific)